MPAGSSGAPGRLPSVRAILGFPRLPEGEIGDGFPVVFVGRVRRAGGVLVLRLEFRPVDAREFAVARAGADLEVYGAVDRLVGVALGDELFDHAHLVRDVLDGGGLDGRALHAERVAVGVEFGRPLGAEILQRDALLHRGTDRLVVHVGDVTDMLHGHTVEFQRPAKDVLRKESAEVADVRRAVDGGTAAIHAVGGFGRGGAQFLFGARKRVEQTDGHDFSGKERSPQKNGLQGQNKGFGGEECRSCQEGREPVSPAPRISPSPASGRRGARCRRRRFRGRRGFRG